MIAYRVLVALTVLFYVEAANADSVESPWRCPPGSYGKSSHYGPYCVPAACDNDDDCGGSDRCVRYRVCIKKTFFRSRYVVPGGGYEHDMVVATCAQSDGCVGGEQDLPTPGKVAPGPATCRDDTFCVPPELPPFPPPEERRGPPVRTASETWDRRASEAIMAASALALAITIVVVLFVRRRRG